jgi:hypothetical protein
VAGGGLGFFAAERLPHVRPDVRLEEAHDRGRALQARRPDAHLRAGGDGEDGVRARGDGTDGLGHAGLEVSPLGQAQGDVPRRLLEAGRPERLAWAQARRAAQGLRLHQAVALDAHLGQQRSLDGAEHHLHAAGRRYRLDHDVRVFPRRVEQLDHVPEELGVERLAGLDLDVAAQTGLVRGVALDAHGGDDRGRGRVRRGRRRPRQEGGEDERVHRACRRRRRSNP